MLPVPGVIESAMVGDSAPLKAEALALMVTMPTKHFIDPVVGMVSRQLSFKQMQNGTVIIGGAIQADVVGDRQQTKLDFAHLRESAMTVNTVFPNLANLPIVRAWAGIEGVMPDKLPVNAPVQLPQMCSTYSVSPPMVFNLLR